MPEIFIFSALRWAADAPRPYTSGQEQPYLLIPGCQAVMESRTLFRGPQAIISIGNTWLAVRPTDASPKTH